MGGSRRRVGLGWVGGWAGALRKEWRGADPEGGAELAADAGAQRVLGGVVSGRGERAGMAASVARRTQGGPPIR